MYFYLIGTDYKIAAAGIKAGLYRLRPKIADFWKNKEAALLFTCNRIEIYAVSKNPDIAFSNIAKFSQCFPDFFRHTYIKYGEKEVFKHALRLASGLESQLQGELQIFYQLYNWHTQEKLPYFLGTLWKEALALARVIRIQSSLDKDKDNIAEVVYFDLINRLKLSREIDIVIVGTGKIAQLLARSHKPGQRLNFVAHKNYQKAKELAMISRGRAFLIKDLAQVLPKADVLISATTSPHYVLKSKDFINLSRSLYIYDLALPADVEPAVKKLPGVYLLNLEDLTEVIQLFNQRNQEKIRLANRLAEEAIEECLEAGYVKNN